MSVQIPFDQHGPYEVALVAFAGMPKRVYHFAKTSGEEESWALRDYVVGQILRFGDSGKTASELESMVVYAEEAPYRSVAHVPSWKTHCQASSDRFFGSVHVDASTPNDDTLGNWRRMGTRGA